MFRWIHDDRLALIPALLLAFALGGCGSNSESVETAIDEQAETVKEGVESVVAEAGLRVQTAILSTMECEEVVGLSVEEGEGYDLPGVSGAERWGIPESPPSSVRVRRSWSTLSDAEKKRVVDAFVALKQTTVGSAAAGAQRADYGTFCPDSYARNLYDYYVELHYSAFVSMGTDDMAHNQMAHMGPQFLPWHRYYLLRLEADIREVLGDPDFALPYWDWDDCQAAEDGSNPCPAIFDTAFLGSPGSCEDGEKDVTGHLVDQGFETHIWSQATAETMFNTGSLQCSTKPLQRAVGCTESAATPPSAADAAAVFDREVYDVEPYDTCNTDQDVSMRQYLEGYRKDEEDALCILAGCETHGRGHVYIGGDMSSGGAPPNDPMFFLHHANVDRLWAQWQDRNRSRAETASDYGNPAYPDDWRGTIFNFDAVRADELFDYRALGYRYDTTEE